MKFETVSVDGVTLAYAEAGEGQPVVCVHGNFASKRWFTPQLLEPPAGARVLALDLPNFGDSDALSEDISTEAYARWLERFIDALGLDHVYLVGHSLGGAVVQTAAARQPERYKGLVLINAAPPDGLKTPEQHYPYLELFKTNRDLLAQSLSAVMPTIQLDYFDDLVNDAWKMNRAAFTENARALDNYDVTEALGEVTAPALVLRGERDSLISEEMARRTAAAFTNSRLELWDVGHSPQLEVPERFNALLGQVLSER